MQFKHILIAILVAAIWGFNFVVVKTGLKEFPPFIYGASRFLLAALPALFIKRPNVSWKILGGIGLFLGVLKFSLMFLGIYLGISAGLASLILQSQIFFTILISMLVFGCRIHPRQVVGMVIAFVGIAIIAWDLNGQSSFVGFLLILGAAASWSISNILYQKAGNVDMFSLTVWSSVIPPIPMFIGAFLMEGSHVFEEVVTHFSWLGLGCLLFTSCGSTLIGATLWGELLKRYDAPIVAPFALLIPLFGLSFAWLIIDEQFSSLTLVACSFVFLGLVVNQWQSKKTKAAKSPQEKESKPELSSYDAAA